MNDISLFFQSVEPLEPISGSLGDRIIYHTDGDFPLIEKNYNIVKDFHNWQNRVEKIETLILNFK